VVRAFTIHDEDADDLFQEIAIQVWQSVPNYQGKSSVSTWLYRIALNTAIRWSKSEKRRGKAEGNSIEHLLDYQPVENDSRLDWLYAQISRMNEVEKSLTLLLLDGFSYREMSEMMGITESNIGVKIHRIKKQLVEKSKTYEDGI
jgi:RNA polymerase sigma-70 factor (ECF subfamily)